MDTATLPQNTVLSQNPAKKNYSQAVHEKTAAQIGELAIQVFQLSTQVELLTAQNTQLNADIAALTAAAIAANPPVVPDTQTVPVVPSISQAAPTAIPSTPVTATMSK